LHFFLGQPGLWSPYLHFPRRFRTSAHHHTQPFFEMGVSQTDVNYHAQLVLEFELRASHYFFLVILGFEFRPLCLQSRWSTLEYTWVFWRWSVMNYLPRLTLSFHLPISASQVAVITVMNHCTQSLLVYWGRVLVSLFSTQSFWISLSFCTKVDEYWTKYLRKPTWRKHTFRLIVSEVLVHHSRESMTEQRTLYHGGQRAMRVRARPPAYGWYCPHSEWVLPHLVNPFWKHPHRHTQRPALLFSWALLNPIKIHHHSRLTPWVP
jgi:hypothetical protein